MATVAGTASPGCRGLTTDPADAHPLRGFAPLNSGVGHYREVLRARVSSSRCPASLSTKLWNDECGQSMFFRRMDGRRILPVW